ncbi:MAG TPA: response regulator transcription factor [Candidatus Gemmiger faecigallinarum]|nr:response regulator transcription factor [Candidatus Gemmiger faecigallinarum]
MANRVLIVEDDTALGEGVRLTLEQYSCKLAPDLAAARRALQRERWDLVILDLNLPDGSGLSLLREVRRSSDLPVLILTANDLEVDEVRGLELGADDYVTKPFSLAVLRARVKNLLRGRRAAGEAVYRQGRFEFDFERMRFAREGVPVELSRTEQRLLRLLVENRGRVLTRARLLDAVWDGGDYVDENALSVTMRRLRAKLVDPPVRTVYGVGYQWEAQP